MINKTSLRAAVLGANDGILSISSALVGIVAAQVSPRIVFITGFFILVAGAFSMATGEYISVKAQEESDAADLAEENSSLVNNWEEESQELASIYYNQGFPREFAYKMVSFFKTPQEALPIHAREELGITIRSQAHPLKAAFSSGASFIAGAIVPLIVATFCRGHAFYIIGASLISLIILGILSAHWGGSSKWKNAVRVFIWGGLAMGVSFLLGSVI